jgi:diguanylate cyclase (GGDEF)-like protein/PAS domain S-box-containing protein
MSPLLDSEICRSILESLPTGLCVVDLQKKIVLWSDGAERITGHRRYEVIGHSCMAEALLHCDQPECEFCNEECPLERAIKTSRTCEAIGFLHHKAGHEIPVRLRSAPVHNAHGSVVGAVEVFEEQQPATGPDHREESLNLPGCVDEVTGIASQVMMRSHLRETLGTFSEVQVPFGILFFRLEGLADFRARFGAPAAISLLRAVAHTLESALWKTDFVGRWSDDQFLVILNVCSKAALHLVCERMRRMLANDGIEWWGERRSLPVSIGQATAETGDTVESLITRAQGSLTASSKERAHGAAVAGVTFFPTSSGGASGTPGS